ncbi:unnamed protein product, partial [Medioppia subpectinata]
KIKDAIERKHYWDGALHAVAVLWEAHGYVWHGYEVIGLDNIPDDGPALIVYYHGAIPIDYYYLSAKCLLTKNRLIRAVGDHFLFRIPAQFGDERYRLMWGQRTGFARVALEAQVPIIPVFTQNIREAFRSLSLGQTFLRRIYERIKLPCVPIYGGFPVKLTTIIGKPIPYDPSITPEELVEKTSLAIEDLIRKNQRVPGSILKAMIDRFYSYPKEKCI